MQGRTHGKMMLLLQTLTTKGRDVVSLVEFRLVVKEKMAWQTNRRTTDARKNNVALAHNYHEGKRCSKFGRTPPSGLGRDSVMD